MIRDPPHADQRAARCAVMLPMLAALRSRSRCWRWARAPGSACSPTATPTTTTATCLGDGPPRLRRRTCEAAGAAPAARSPRSPGAPASTSAPVDVTDDDADPLARAARLARRWSTGWTTLRQPPSPSPAQTRRAIVQRRPHGRRTSPALAAEAPPDATLAIFHTAALVLRAERLDARRGGSRGPSSSYQPSQPASAPSATIANPGPVVDASRSVPHQSAHARAAAMIAFERRGGRPAEQRPQRHPLAAQRRISR